MPNYYVESRPRPLTIIFLIGGVGIATFTISLLVFLRLEINAGTSVFVCIGIACIVGYYWMKYVRKRWEVDYVEIRFEKKGRGRIVFVKKDYKKAVVSKKEVWLTDIVSYRAASYDGSEFYMKLKNGKTFTLVENDYKTNGLGSFISAFEDHIQRKKELSIIRKLNWMEGRAGLIMIVLFSLLLLVATLYLFIADEVDLETYFGLIASTLPVILMIYLSRKDDKKKYRM